jgi:hypothetical protein
MVAQHRWRKERLLDEELKRVEPAAWLVGQCTKSEASSRRKSQEQGHKGIPSKGKGEFIKYDMS